MNSDKALESSVLPTPVGPKNIKEPRGLSWSAKPARLRRKAEAITLIAFSWPITLLLKTSSIFINFAASDSIILLTGIPVQRETTEATSSSSTASFKNLS